MKGSMINLRIDTKSKSILKEKAYECNMSVSEYALDAIKAKIEGRLNSPIPKGAELANAIGTLNTMIYNNRENINNEKIDTLIDAIDNINANIINICSILKNK